MTTDCVHRWVIEPPAGPTSWGECKHCHERREFSNWAAEDAQKLISAQGSKASQAKAKKQVPLTNLSGHREFYVDGLRGRK